MDNAETPEFREVSSEAAESSAAEIAVATPTNDEPRRKLVTKTKVAILALAVCAMAWLGVLLWPRSSFQGEPPVEMRLREPAFTGIVAAFWMKLSNRGEGPLWLVLPTRWDEELPERTLFRREADHSAFEKRFERTRFHDRQGTVALGVSCTDFRAFRVPARTTMEIPAYDIPTKFLHSRITVVEARELLVNGKTPLEKWLPFRVGVSKQEELRPDGVDSRSVTDSYGHDRSGEWFLAEEERRGDSPRIPREKVESIEAQGTHRWILQIPREGINSLDRLRLLRVGIGVDEKDRNLVTSLDYSAALIVPVDADLAYVGSLTQLRRLEFGNWIAELFKASHEARGKSFNEDEGITDAGLQHLAGLQQLEELRLSYSSVTGTGLPALKGLSRLRTLNLTDTNVTDATLKHIAKLTGVQELILGSSEGVKGHGITDAGLRRLAGMTQLRRLVLLHTSATDAGVRKLREALPDCEISHRP